MPSFSTALSGLNANSTAIDTVGNNLANLNTTGFKASATSFRDLVSQTIGVAGNSSQLGLGVNRPINVRQFSQGSVQNTTAALDAAIQGQGFFVARTQSGTNVLTRAGNFSVDRSGNLLTANGDAVLGWTEANGVMNTGGPISAIRLPFGTLRPPAATTTASVDLNLNAETAVDGTFSTPIQVVDSLGASHVMTVTFTKTAPNEWEYTVTIPGEELTSGTAGTPSEIATGTVTFDDEGILTAPAAPGDVELTIAGLANGAADLEVNWSLYNAAERPRLTQFSTDSAASANAQDGSTAAQLVRVGIGDGGRILAQYSNGTELTVAQLALGSVINPETLLSVGNNNFVLSAETSALTVGLPDTGGRGSIFGSALEASTVDIAKEFTNLIVYQRGYQANSRVITTLDELSQETLNLKR